MSASLKPHGTRAVDNLLAIGWWGVMTLLPIGHVTGLRNTVSTLVVLGTVVWLGKDAWRGVPARSIGVALLAWCAASVAWSAVPDVSIGKWRTDLLLPLLAYAAAFGYVRRSGRIDVIIGGTVTGARVVVAAGDILERVRIAPHAVVALRGISQCREPAADLVSGCG